MNSFIGSLSLLRKYFQMYWLKPFDAVNDAANAAALLKFDWSKQPVLEVGGGDGVFSFIMHGGAFSFSDDRYDQTDTAIKGDIYDIYKKGYKLKRVKNAALEYDLGVDLKLSHLFKSRETGLYKNLVSSVPEALPLKGGYFGTVFLYTFHGLSDYRKTLQEIRRVMKKDGILLMIAVNSAVKKNFVCHKLHLYFKRAGLDRLSRYFLAIDGGRQAEIGELFSRSVDEWRCLLKDSGFQMVEANSQVSPLLWKIYDTQTRPLLKGMIKVNRILKRMRLAAIAKFFWICFWFPILSICYFTLARPVAAGFNEEADNIFLAVRARAV